MIKKILMMVLLMVYGATAGVQAQDVAKAKEILNKVSAKYKGYKTVKADFKYTLEIQAQKFKEEQKGTLYLKGGKFRLDMGNQTVISDGKTMWTYLKESNEVQINNFDSKALGINPAEIFTMYEKGFLYAYMGDQTVNGKSCYAIELTPTDKKQTYFKIKMYVDKKTNNIVQSKIMEKNGNIYTYDITTFTPNVELAETFFTFDKTKYPKVSVVDLR
jgi:outer membrane lipoprotein-sorting protein